MLSEPEAFRPLSYGYEQLLLHRLLRLSEPEALRPLSYGYEQLFLHRLLSWVLGQIQLL